MKVVKILFNILFAGLLVQVGLHCSAQCNVDSPNTQIGFTPTASTPVVNGTPTSQTAQLYIMHSVTVQSATATVDSVNFSAVNGLPAGVTYAFNPVSATIRGGGNGALCFSGTPTSGGGAYPLSFIGTAYTNFGPVPFSNIDNFNALFNYTFQVIGPPVAAFSAAQYCAGDTIIFIDLSAAAPPDTAWRWTFAGATPSTSLQRDPRVVYPVAGTYPVKLVVVNAYGADSLSKNILIGAPPTATVATTMATGADSANGTATLTVTSGYPPYNVFWSQGTDSTVATGLLPGIYTVTLYDSLGCEYSNDSVVIAFISTGIIQLGAAQQVKIYPNPTAGILNLNWSQPSNADIAIVDLKGNIVASYVSTGKSLDVFDIQTITNGAYILRITDKSTNQQRSMLFNKL